MKLIDCHTHLHDFDEAEISKVIQRANHARVAAIITAGTKIKSSEKLCLQFGHKFEYSHSFFKHV